MLCKARTKQKLKDKKTKKKQTRENCPKNILMVLNKKSNNLEATAEETELDKDLLLCFKHGDFDLFELIADAAKEPEVTERSPQISAARESRFKLFYHNALHCIHKFNHNALHPKFFTMCSSS